MQKYWVHMITSANAFELYARDLLIEHADVKYHWSWKTEDNIEIAELVQVHWLDVKTNFPAQMLTPRTSYEVLFVLRRNEKAKELTNSNLKLVLPNQNASEVTVDLSTLPTNEWKEIQVGGFESSCGMSGDMEISLYEHNSQIKKVGLVVNKIIIRPVMNWKKLSGENDWEGLLNPLNVDLNKNITFYGDSVHAIYDSISKDATSQGYAYPKYGELIFSIRQDGSTWIGYVAVATDEGKKVLGRRDVLVCWRGTSSDGEWFKNLQIMSPIYPQLIFPFVRHPKVHQGFYSVYTEPNPASNKEERNARDQVLQEVRSWVNEYKDEEVSITVTGHSLGAALATLNATDIVSNGYNMPNPNPGNKEFLVTAFVFGSPKCGDEEFKNEFDRLTRNNWKLRLLRITNDDDAITRLPKFTPVKFVEVGNEITISTTNASEDEGNKVSTAHSLKNYIKELCVLQSPLCA
ncbi:phospholipase A1-II 1-like [Mangifera indica]|uniref:phospholipase A1-II 1-like n=1 Tax=Mangifera indica TaxID=29780 RepID=UPI001CFB03A8|nr:phospholipase A1-II 1-like [Mangifera indica]